MKNAIVPLVVMLALSLNAFADESKVTLFLGDYNDATIQVTNHAPVEKTCTMYLGDYNDATIKVACGVPVTSSHINHDSSVGY